MKTLGELVVDLAPLNESEKELVGMVQHLVDKVRNTLECEDPKCETCRKLLNKMIEGIGALP